MEQQKTKRTLKYEFSDLEKLELGRDLSSKNQELRQLEEQKKSVVAEFGSRIAVAKEMISSLSDKVASGYEMRDTTVMIDYHLPERGKKILTRTDTGESWVEPMNDTDHNLFTQWEQRELEREQSEEEELADSIQVDEADAEMEPDQDELPRKSNGQFTSKKQPA